MSLRSALVLLAATAAAAPAAAQVAVSLDAGSTGAGLHLVVPMESDLNGRFGLNGYTRDQDKEVSAINYQLKTKLKTIDILFDWYLIPTSTFHLTGGVVHNQNRVDAVGKPGADGNYQIDGVSYPAATVGTLSGDVRFRQASPYLGIGWGNPLRSKGSWSLLTDVGAFFQGSPRAHLVSRGCVVSNAACTTLAKSVAAEQAGFNEDIHSFKAYPVLRAALAYRF